MKIASWLDSCRRCWRWYLAVLVLILLDQYTKSLVTQHLLYARPLAILPVLDFTLLHNTGAAFSFLSDAGGWQRWFFTLLASVVSLLLVIWLPQQPGRLARLALALILAGALGNLIDRISLGYVVDFISLHYGGKYFPAFNLADSCISIGAALLVLQWIQESRSDSHD